MAFVVADRVKETTTTNGTGAVALAGAATGFRTFASGIGNSNTTYYTIAHQTANEWEVGYGTLDSTSENLARTTVLASSNSGSLVTFTAGTKDVFVTQSAARTLVQANGGTSTNGVLYYTGSGVATGGTALTFDGTTLNTTGNITLSSSQVLAASNYNSYAPTLTGTGASGTWGISISGNAATATSATDSTKLPLAGGTMTGAISMSSGIPWQVFTPGSGTYDKYVQYINSSGYTLEAAFDTDSIAGSKLPITFTWRGGYSATGGLQLTGGSSGSLGGNTILHAANYNSYAPTLTGTGASGTWGISISGNAAGLSSTLAVGSGGTGVTTSTGSGSVVLSTSPTLVTPILGTPSSGTLTNCTFPTLNQNTTGTAAGLSATLAVASGGTGVTSSTGTGSNVLSSSPSLTNPTFTNYTETRYSATVTSNAITLDLANGTFQTITTMVGANAITLPAVGSGKSLTVQILYASTPTTLTFASPSGSLKYPNGATPAPTLTNTKYDFYSFVSDGTNWYGVQTGANF
jgi:hypothetical protein